LETIKAIHSRNSISNLTDPCPNKVEMEVVYKSALRAPDHAWLRPWKFIQVTGESRSKLSDAFLKTYKELGQDLSDELIQKIKKAPFRAPMVLVLIAEVKEHPKVPAIEQMLSTGSAAQNMLITLHDMGYGAIWRTGKMSFNQHITEALGLSKVSQVIGYLYIGTPNSDGRVKKIPNLKSEDYVSFWE
jgi:nitroreductase